MEQNKKDTFDKVYNVIRFLMGGLFPGVMFWVVGAHPSVVSLAAIVGFYYTHNRMKLEEERERTDRMLDWHKDVIVKLEQRVKELEKQKEEDTW